MVLFDLSSVRGAAVTAHDNHASSFQRDVLTSLTPVKSVKRLVSHPWPFPANFPAKQVASELRSSNRPVAGFVT